MNSMNPWYLLLALNSICVYLFLQLPISVPSSFVGFFNGCIYYILIDKILNKEPFL